MNRKKIVTEEMPRIDIYYIMSNIKGIMMLLIVMFHCVSPVINSTRFSYIGEASLPLLIAISLLAMVMLSAVPSFVLITGYGSKDVESCGKDAFGHYFIPYIVLTLLLAVEYSFVNGVFYVDVFEPLMQLWFLMAMYIWMITLRDVSSIKFAVPLSILLSLVSGMVANGDVFKFTFGVSSFFSLSYVFTFLPFLIIGTRITGATLSRVRNSGAAWTAAAAALMLAIAVGLGCTFYFSDKYSLFDITSIRGNGNYLTYFGGESGFSSYAEVNIYGALLRVLMILFVFALAFVMFRFIPNKRVPLLTRVGEASMTVFCLHIFFLVPIASLIKADLLIQLSISIPVSVAVCWLLSCRKINKAFMRAVFWVSDAITVKKEKT